MSAAAQQLARLIPESVGCSAEWLRMQTGWTLQQVEEGLHQAVAAGLAIRKDNRYSHLVVHPAPASAADPASAPPAEDTSMANTKTCIKCDIDLPLDQFGFDTRTVDGRARTCRNCRRKPAPAEAKPKAGRKANGATKAKPEIKRPLKRIVERLERSRESCFAAALEQLRAQRAKLDQAIAALEALE